MQIKRLKINEHLCLVDFKINFQASNNGSTTILIGENGTGKSTMISTILEILMSFDSPAVEKDIDYDYEIEYVYAQTTHVIVKEDKYYKLSMRDEEVEGKYAKIRNFLQGKRIFPQRIIAFYSGANNKIEDKIRRQNNQYVSLCRKELQTYLWSKSEDKLFPYFPKRKYNYCSETLVPIYLTAILCAGDQSREKKHLQTKCHFTKVETADVTINLDKVENIFGKKRFGKDRLRFDNSAPEIFYAISDYIDSRFTNLFRQGLLYVDRGKGYFEIKNIEKIGADSIAILDYFEKLQSLFDAQYEVNVLIGETSVKVSRLSEGQRQLIKVLGMMGISKSEDCLILMDEPDAHMNPKWKYEIYETMHKSLSSAINTQAIIATHDPLVINGVPKENIRVFTYNEAMIRNNNFYVTKVIVPTENTEGLGIDGLLQSEYYGLPTVLDTSTREKMNKKESLLVKKVDGTLTDKENEQLQKLREELEDMYFARNIPTEQYYDEYVAAMHKIYRERPKVYLSLKDIEERNKQAEEILRRLLNK